MEELTYKSYGRVMRLANDTHEILITLDVGPRIIRYARIGGENILGEHPEAALQTPVGEWKPYGGHRLWAAPEVMPDTYYPDNDPIELRKTGERSCVLIPRPEKEYGLQKEIAIDLDAKSSKVTIGHTITNISSARKKLAAWSLTIMRGISTGGKAGIGMVNGRVILPQEPFRSHDEYLLPARPLVLWYFTDLTDDRIALGKKYIELRVDTSKGDPQKIGILNKQGWAAYLLGEELFVKKFDYLEGEEYPDYNSNNEAYTAGEFLELETLSPLVTLQPGDTVTHFETWHLLQSDRLQAFDVMQRNTSDLLEELMAPIRVA